MMESSVNCYENEAVGAYSDRGSSSINLDQLGLVYLLVAEGTVCPHNQPSEDHTFALSFENPATTVA